MKRIHFLALIVILLLAACSQASGQNQATPTSLSYPTSQSGSQPTSQPASVEIVQQQWFSEHFKDGLPPNWVASPGWKAGSSSVWTDQREQTFRIPAEWTDLVIHARLRRGPQNWSSIGFRDKDNNYYQLSYNESSLILGRHRSDAYHGEMVANYQMTVSEDWHDLLIAVVGGHITVTWDGRKVIDYTDSDPLPAGDIFVQNWDSARYELDLLEVSPPEEVASGGGGGQATSAAPGPTQGSGGSGGSVAAATDTPVFGASPFTSPTPTDTPPPSGGGGSGRTPTGPVIDLAVSGGYFDGRGNLFCTIFNNGPDPFVGALDVACTIWYDSTPAPFGLGDTVTQSFILEPGQGQEVQTNCTVDNSEGPLLGGNVSIDTLSADPNPANNWFIVEP